MTKRERTKTVVVVAAVLSLAMACCPTLSEAARVDEEAVVLAGGELQQVTFVNNDDGSVTLAFTRQNTKYPPRPAVGTAEALIGTSDGAFVGDYVKAGVAGLKFSAAGDGHVPASIEAQIECSAEEGTRVWYCSAVTVSDVAGEATVNSIALTREAGWDVAELGATDEEKDALWLADLRSVTRIGIEIMPSGAEAQSYTIADFKLVDVNGLESDSAILTLQEALMARFGVGTLEEIADADLDVDGDNDGMTDVVEILTEYDEDFENSTFAAEIVAVDENGATIRWACRQGRQYEVFRCDSLKATQFAPADGAALVASETGFMTHTVPGTDGAGQYFYRVKRVE